MDSPRAGCRVFSRVRGENGALHASFGDLRGRDGRRFGSRWPLLSRKPLESGLRIGGILPLSSRKEACKVLIFPLGSEIHADSAGDGRLPGRISTWPRLRTAGAGGIPHTEGRFSTSHGAIRQTEGTRTLRNRHMRRNIWPRSKGHGRCRESAPALSLPYSISQMPESALSVPYTTSRLRYRMPEPRRLPDTRRARHEGGLYAYPEPVRRTGAAVACGRADAVTRSDM
ncbi:hypothetical protein D2E24_0377 [Bifidobacterium samirii]|uniref:Uncharacterized protein n=1 Tax=Bifidobacterium samirii TaxID=2306974 RepID=A0A430FWD6_9BIFI|nr:hypothetical protein D2E24_0377 [Bifidobacterium samirii]